MNNYATPSQNPPTKQNPARSSREFMKHSGCSSQGEKMKSMRLSMRLLAALLLAGISIAVASGARA
ncbi:MAG: hypothetical protein L0H75_01040 [Nitrosospira sp.]|nr:hypothetical protein [Nitrosospira sp.]